MSRGLAALLALTVGAGCTPPSTWYGLSPDHRRAFSVQDEGGSICVRLDAEAPRCFDGVAISRIAFSPDSRHMAYPVEDGGRWYVVHDGVPGASVDGVGEIVFSPDGGRLAYSAERDGAWHVVVDGSSGPPFDSLRAGSLVFDPAGRRHGYVAFTSGKEAAVVDGVAARDHLAVARLRFSPWGGRTGYVARDPDGVRLYIDGVPGLAHDGIQGFAFDPAGGAAYIANDGGRTWVVHDTTRWGPYLGVANIAFRPAGGE
ncbi:MAG: hypothetical protein OEZ37_13295, partial [Gemmatimonadota bacterium]|nr:hypothetical protein [Gemmatimonadota bacterium]